MATDAFQTTALIDTYGRKVRYLRLSLTDRCNLRCLYCQSPAAVRFIPHDHILHYEEMLRIVRILRASGVEKVRLTGGEPFVRKGSLNFLAMLRAENPDLDLRITSNGTLLADLAPELKKIGVNGVNLSLDSFDAKTFAEITGRDMLSKVLAGLDALLVQNIPVKLNAVALRGITEKELDNFLHVATTMNLDVRFIEFMPMGEHTRWGKDLFLPVEALIRQAREKYSLVREEVTSLTLGPARMYRIEGKRGRLGFISPVSSHFCHSCNRLRLTAEGRLRLCLYDDREYPLRGVLRDPNVRDEDLCRQIASYVHRKPLGIQLLEARKRNCVATRGMSGIGG